MRVFAAVKQVPAVEALLGPTGRLRREGIPLEMSAYCRRAVAKGVEIASETAGTCLVATLGPPSAELVLREALAWGADDAVLLSDAVFAGSDTLATARALAGLVTLEGPFDLLLVGRSSLDSETGQVGPELAELLDLPFAAAVRELELLEGHDHVRVRCEQDDGWRVSVVQLPAVLAVAERLCRPAKVPPEVWRAISPELVRRRSSNDLGAPGPWGSEGSPTEVVSIRAVDSSRSRFRCTGTIDAQVAMALSQLDARGALSPQAPTSPPVMPAIEAVAGAPAVAVLVEPDRPTLARELLGCAVNLAVKASTRVVAVVPESLDQCDAWSWGADEIVIIVGADTEEDVASGVSVWATRARPAVVLASATYWGREVASRVAARLGAGLTGDALELEMDGQVLVAWKPASGGAQLAAIRAKSSTQMVTVRPGVFRAPLARTGAGAAAVTSIAVTSRNRVHYEAAQRDDNLELLQRASVVIGVGGAVQPDEYGKIRRLGTLLGAEIAATRKVTDAGWLPRSRQVGITGRSIAPRLYVAVGLHGKANHLAGVRGAGTILAVNHDPRAPVFDESDVGILGDWRDVVPALSSALEAMQLGVDVGLRSLGDPAVLGAGSDAREFDV